jgi:hypothetical protein
MNLLDRDRIIGLLTELGSRLAANGEHADLFVVGGAAMALAYSTRRSTRDLDAVFEPKQAVYTAARDIARAHDLPEAWLNDEKWVVAASTPAQPPRCSTPRLPGQRTASCSHAARFAQKFKIRFIT